MAMERTNRIWAMAAAGLTALALLAAPLGALAQNEPGDKEFADAQALFKAKKYPDAAAAFRKFLAEFSKHELAVDAELRLGDSLLELNMPAEALKTFEGALDPKPADDLRVQALFGMARAHVALKEDDKAVPPLETAFALTEYHEELGPLIGQLLGEAQTRRKKYREAAKAYYRVTRWPMNKLAPNAYLQVGHSYRSAGDLADAVINYRNAVERYFRDPIAPTASLAAGEVNITLKRPQEAESDFQRILKEFAQSPEAPRAQLAIGDLAAAQENWVVARAAYQAATILFPMVAAEAELRLAHTFLSEKNTDEALKRYAALTGSKDRLVAGEARYTLGTYHQRKGELGPASEQFNKLAEDKEAGKWSQLARLRVAELRASAGDTAAAVASLRSIQAEPAEAGLRDEASLLLGQVLVQRGEAAEAEKELNGLIERSPDGPQADPARVALAQSRLQQKDATGAITRAQEALKRELKPDVRAAALATLGKAQIRQKQEKEGVASLREVLAKHPDAPIASETAETLLAYFNEAGDKKSAEEVESIIAMRYGGGNVAVADLLDRADKQLQAKGYAEAAGLYQQVLDKKPNRSQRLKARSGLAESAAATGKFALVDEQMKLLTSDAPPPGVAARTWLRVGQTYYASGAAEKAAGAFNAARGAGPEEDTAPGILLGLSRLASDAGRHADAETHLRGLIEKYPKSPLMPEALYALAWTQIDQKQADDARPVFVRLTKDYPAHPLAADASFRLAEREFETKNYSAAIERYRTAAAGKGPAAAAAGYKLGWALRLSGDHAGAAKAFADVALAHPESGVALESRLRAAESLIEKEDEDAALALLEPVVDAKPKSADERGIVLQIQVAAAMANLMAGTFDKAKTLSEPIAVPTNGWIGARAHRVRAEAIFLKDGPKAALPEYTRGASLFSRYREVAGELQFRAAECHDKLGNTKAAQAAYQRVVDLYPNTEWARRSQEKLSPAGGASAASK